MGLSVLWTLYAAATLAWGFVRRSVALRYAALFLFGLTIVKVFFVDLASVKTAYRMLSLLILGVVLLLGTVWLATHLAVRIFTPKDSPFAGGPVV